MPRTTSLPFGQFRKRVTLQSPAETSDGFGDTMRTWSTIGTYWASLTFSGGGEQVNAGQEKALASHRVRMRYVGPIDPSMRLLFGSRVFNILTVNNIDERNREYELIVREVLQPVTTP